MIDNKITNSNEKMSKKTKIFFKLDTIFMGILFVATIFFTSYKSGFQFKDENLGIVTLSDLTGTTYELILSGIILSTVSLSLFLISTIFGRLLKTFNQYLWKISVFILFVGLILVVTGEGYFAVITEEFTKIFNQTVFVATITLTAVLGLCAVALGITDIWQFNKERKKNKEKNTIKNNNLKNEIKINQLNPKFRLFILIFVNWLFPIYYSFCFWIFFSIPYIYEHYYIFPILLIGFVPLYFPIFYYTMGIGIEYLPKDLKEHYVKINHNQLKKWKNLEVTDVTQLFKVIPICDELYSKKARFDTRTKEEFTNLSWIEETNNRLVVNGKINSSDFSWGVVTKIKKNSFRTFLFSILCFNPIAGIFIGLNVSKIVNVNLSDSIWLSEIAKKNKKLGCLDLFPYHISKQNSENYLIFSAKLQQENDLITLIPKSNERELINFNAQYDWPRNLSSIQKKKLQDLIQEMSFLPSIYIYKNQISILMKKYHYNDQDNCELQTWELIKDPQTDSQIQFNYLNQAIKIYHIFNGRDEYD